MYDYNETEQKRMKRIDKTQTGALPNKLFFIAAKRWFSERFL